MDLNSGKCPICLQVKEDEAMIEPCMHSFCSLCILHWLEMSLHCPLCRKTANVIVREISVETKHFVRVPLSYSYEVRKLLDEYEQHHLSDNVRLRFAVYNLSLEAVVDFDVYAFSHDEYIASKSTPRPLKRTNKFTLNQVWNKLPSWLNRELYVVLNHHMTLDQIERDDEIQLVSLILNRILKEGLAITQSTTAKEKLEGFMLDKTDKFLKELELFLRSPFPSVEDFDHNVHYKTPDDDSPSNSQ